MKTDDKKFITKRRLKNFELYQANKKDQTYMADQTNLAKFSYSLLIHNEPLEDSRSGQDQYDENEYFVPFEENGVEIVKK